MSEGLLGNCSGLLFLAHIWFSPLDYSSQQLPTFKTTRNLRQARGVEGDEEQTKKGKHSEGSRITEEASGAAPSSIGAHSHQSTDLPFPSLAFLRWGRKARRGQLEMAHWNFWELLGSLKVLPNHHRQ